MPPKKGAAKPKPGQKPGAKPGIILKPGDLPKPKKPPPPPKCFNNDDLERLQELFKLYDEDQTGKVAVVVDDVSRGGSLHKLYYDPQIPLKLVATMIRKLGFNPKGAEVEELFKQFLEDEWQDTIEIHDWYKMVEAKLSWGDDIEHDVEMAFKFLGHDDAETGFINIETLKTELMEWGEPLTEKEFKDFPKAALKEKSLEFETGILNYPKFLENMNSKDTKYAPEPVNFWKLDQKTLAAMAMAKRDAETAEMERREAERKAKEEYKRQKMIEAGLIQVQ